MDTSVPFNENEPFEIRREKALIEVKEVLKKWQVQMRAEFRSTVTEIKCAIVVCDALPQVDESKLDSVG